MKHFKIRSIKTNGFLVSLKEVTKTSALTKDDPLTKSNFC